MRKHLAPLHVYLSAIITPATNLPVTAPALARRTHRSELLASLLRPSPEDDPATRKAKEYAWYPSGDGDPFVDMRAATRVGRSVPRSLQVPSHFFTYTAGRGPPRRASFFPLPAGDCGSGPCEGGKDAGTWRLVPRAKVPEITSKVRMGCRRESPKLAPLMPCGTPLQEATHGEQPLQGAHKAAARECAGQASAPGHAQRAWQATPRQQRCVVCAYYRLCSTATCLQS